MDSLNYLLRNEEQEEMASRGSGCDRFSWSPPCTGIPKNASCGPHNWAYDWTDVEKNTMKALVDLEVHRDKDPEAFAENFKAKLFGEIFGATSFACDPDEDELPSHLSTAYRQYERITRLSQEDVVQILAWAIWEKKLENREHCKRPSAADIP